MLRAWREARRWDLPRMARELRNAADEPVAAQAGLIRMIRSWEDGSHVMRERYALLYRKLGYPGGVNGTEVRARAEAALRRADALPGVITVEEAEALRWARAGDAATIRELAATVERLRGQMKDMQAQLRDLLGGPGE